MKPLLRWIGLACTLLLLAPGLQAAEARTRTAVSFDLLGLGEGPLGTYLRRHWNDPPETMATNIQQRFFFGTNFAGLQKEAPKLGMSCDAEACRYQGKVRAYIHSSRINPNYLGANNTLQLDITANEQNGQVVVHVQKTPL